MALLMNAFSMLIAALRGEMKRISALPLRHLIQLRASQEEGYRVGVIQSHRLSVTNIAKSLIA